MDYHNVYKKAESFVKDLFQQYADKNLLFHSLEHTQNVVERSKEISATFDLPEKRTVHHLHRCLVSRYRAFTGRPLKT